MKKFKFTNRAEEELNIDNVDERIKTIYKEVFEIDFYLEKNLIGGLVV